MSEYSKVRDFTDLVTWQKGHELVLAVYARVKLLPVAERYGLTSQMTRAAVSITSNIAEGFSRATSADQTHFYTISLGSLTEVQNQLLIARDVGYMTSDEFDVIAEKTVEVQRLLNGLTKASREGKGAYDAAT